MREFKHLGSAMVVVKKGQIEGEVKDDGSFHLSVDEKVGIL